MISPLQLARLNRILGDALGLIPAGYAESGQSRYQWKRSEALMFLYRTGTRRVEKESPEGLAVILDEPQFVYDKQTEAEGWVIAQWNAPPLPLEWEMQYGAKTGYPKDGYWFTVLAIRPDAEPSEEFCHLCADQMRWQADLGFEKIVEMMRVRREKRDAHQDSEIRALYDSVLPTVPHVPGKRGGSYSVPQTRFDR